MKPKSTKKKGGGYDDCGTPTYALRPLLPYIENKVVWESASNGDGLIAKALLDWGKCLSVIETGLFGQPGDDTFLDYTVYTPIFTYDIQVTNPPYSIKYDWLHIACEIDFPFALLLPLETLGSGKGSYLVKEYGLELIVMDHRVNFKMPVKGWDCSAQFPVAWFTRKLGLGRDITVCEIDNKVDPLTPLAKL